MRPRGIGVKLSLARSFNKPPSDRTLRTMYRVCWAAHRNYQSKSYHFFSVHYHTGTLLTIEMVICPRCGRDSRPAPPWVRKEISAGVLIGQGLLKKQSSLKDWHDARKDSKNHATR